LRTIQNRVLSSEQRAGLLLELYRQVLTSGQIPLNNSSEERELQLSGLVVKRGNVLQVHNPIYAKVFDESWIDAELGKLRPYAANYRIWLRTGKTDSSRLLRGQALEDAEAWALGKNLGGEDRDFLGASRVREREEEIIKKEKEAELERERKAKEVAESANCKAQRRIRIGNIILVITLISAAIAGGFGLSQVREAEVAKKEAEIAKKEAEVAIAKKQEAEKQFKEVIVLLNNTNKKQEKTDSTTLRVKQAQEKLNELNLNSLNRKSQLDPNILNQYRAFAYFQAGKVKEQRYYKDAYNALKDSNFNPFNPSIETDILNEKDVENIHWEVIKSQNIDVNSKTDLIAISFRAHLYAALEFLLQKNLLREANIKTLEIMLYIARRKDDGFLNLESIADFDCNALKEIDKRWINYPEPGTRHFGFSVQQNIWQNNGSPSADSQIEMWRKFYIDLGWKTQNSGIESSEGYLNHELLVEYTKYTRDLTTDKVSLPVMNKGRLPAVIGYKGILFSRCGL